MLSLNIPSKLSLCVYGEKVTAGFVSEDICYLYTQREIQSTRRRWSSTGAAAIAQIAAPCRGSLYFKIDTRHLERLGEN